MSIEKYSELDLSEESQIAQTLFNHVEAEASGEPKPLTGDGDKGSHSANLTPAMNTWLGQKIQPCRLAALTEIEAMAARIKIGKNSSGQVFEIEEDKFRRERNERRTAVRVQFYDNHSSKINELSAVEEEFDAMRVDEAGRDPMPPRKYLKFLIPVLIMIPEIPINFAGFRAIPGVTSDAMALALSLAVGALIGMSAYFIGDILKAYHHYMPDDDDKQRREGLTRISIGTLFLFISLLAVAYSRYMLITPQIAESIILGQDPPNLFASIGGSLFGNIVVWGFGAGATYLLHDRNPEYARKAATLGQMKSEVEAIEKKQLIGKLGQLDAAYKSNVDKLRQRCELMKTHKDYPQMREQFREIENKDGQAVALLQGYRNRLSQRIESEAPDYRFLSAHDARSAGDNARGPTLSDFCGLRISLYMST